MEEFLKLDHLDRQLVEALQKDAKKPLKRLSHTLGKPASTLFERIRRLEKHGVLKRYTVDVDWEKLGYATQAFVLVKFDPSAKIGQRALAERLLKLPAVHASHVIAGEQDLLLHVRAHSTRALGEVVVEKIRGQEGVLETRSLVVFHSARSGQ